MYESEIAAVNSISHTEWKKALYSQLRVATWILLLNELYKYFEHQKPKRNIKNRDSRFYVKT